MYLALVLLIMKTSYLIHFLAVQDRIVLSMEQELLRAYQRASKSPNPLSVCSVLLEQLLPKNVYELSGEVADQGCGVVGGNSVSAVDTKAMRYMNVW